MATLTKRGKRWRALVRKTGFYKCETFGTRAAAKAWADAVEAEVDELRASGIMQPRGLTVADLIDRYTLEVYPFKKWGRSKSADLGRLKKDLGAKDVSDLEGVHITDHFRKRHADGAGAVVISGQLGYLVTVLKVARTLWHLDVPLQAAINARAALATLGLVGKSKQRDRRVTDAELQKLIGYFRKHAGVINFPDVLQFCLASGMRISEVCRLTWADLNTEDKTILIRDRKHPTDKVGNDQSVPLLNETGYDAYAIIDRQRRRGPRIFPYSARTISSLVTRAARKLKLHDLRLHDLRHEAISRLFEAGYRIEQVALVSGHRDWAMLKRYTHLKSCGPASQRCQVMIKREPSAHQAESLMAAIDPEQWATFVLNRCKDDWHSGDKRSLAIAIQVAGEFQRPLPRWAADAFNAALYSIMEFEISSWDEVFGGNPKTPKRLAIARRNRMAQIAILKWIDKHPRRSIDGTLWEDLGKAAKISAAKAQKLYYRLPEEARLPPGNSVNHA